MVSTTSSVQEQPSTASGTREYRLPEANCPSCSGVGLNVFETEYNVENFGSVLVSVSSCESCSYKHTDVLSVTAHEPTATTVKALSTQELKIRVIRGSTATVLVPELGVSIQPGLNNEGFISNVERVLSRIEDVLRFLARSLQGSKKQRADLILRKIGKAREGRLRFALVLKDPFGNSTIVSEKAKRRRIRKRELSKLKFGAYAIAAGK